MGRQAKYASDDARTKAARERSRLRDLPKKLIGARTRHQHVVREAKRAGFDHLLEGNERDWA